MTGDPTLDAVIAGILSFLGTALVFEIAIGWLTGASAGKDGGGVSYD